MAPHAVQLVEDAEIGRVQARTAGPWWGSDTAVGRSQLSTARAISSKLDATIELQT